MSEQKALPTPLLSNAEVQAILRVSRTKLWELQFDKAFPKPVVFGRSFKRWKASDIEAYIDASQK